MVFFIYTLYIFKRNVHSTNEFRWENIGIMGYYQFSSAMPLGSVNLLNQYYSGAP